MRDCGARVRHTQPGPPRPDSSVGGGDLSVARRLWSVVSRAILLHQARQGRCGKRRGRQGKGEGVGKFGIHIPGGVGAMRRCKGHAKVKQ